MEIKNNEGLLTYQNGKTEHCLGYLMNFHGKGVYEPNLGLVEVSPEDAETHNRVLSCAEIRGLDECLIGQSGFFYYSNKDNCVKTWVGEVVSTEVTVKGNTITFRRNNGNVFRGKLQKDADCFNFKRIK